MYLWWDKNIVFQQAVQKGSLHMGKNLVLPKATDINGNFYNRIDSCQQVPQKLQFQLQLQNIMLQFLKCIMTKLRYFVMKT